MTNIDARKNFLLDIIAKTVAINKVNTVPDALTLVNLNSNPNTAIKMDRVFI
jgi:hypothetical protein